MRAGNLAKHFISLNFRLVCFLKSGFFVFFFTKQYNLDLSFRQMENIAGMVLLYPARISKVLQIGSSGFKNHQNSNLHLWWCIEIPISVCHL